jgi:hypothetical protein
VDMKEHIRKTANGRESIASKYLPDELIDPESYEHTWRRVCDAAVAAGYAHGALEAPLGYPAEYDSKALYVTGASALHDRVHKKRRRSAGGVGSKSRRQSEYEERLLSNACMLVSRRMEFSAELRQLRLPRGVTVELAARIVSIALKGSSDAEEETAARLDGVPRTTCMIDVEEIRRAVRPGVEGCLPGDTGTDEQICSLLADHWARWIALQEEHGGLGTTLAEISARSQLAAVDALRAELRGS